MEKWNQIEAIKVGDIVRKGNGLNCPDSELEVLSIKVDKTYAIMTWKWLNSSTSYYSTDFRKSENMIDYGFWHDLTSQQYSL